MTVARLRRSLASLLVAAVVATLALVGASPAAAAGPYSISGTVKLEDGSPLVGFTVEAKLGFFNPITVTTTTNGAGEYQLAPSSTGTWNVSVTTTDVYHGPSSRMVSITDGAPAATADFTLRPWRTGTSTVSGTVTDADSGLPIQGATVNFEGLDDAKNATTVSDAAGHYSLANLPVGTYYLVAFNSGYVSKSVTLVIASDGSSQTVDFGMRAGTATISGTITDQSMTPLQGMGLSARNDVYGSGTSAGTDASGGYALTGLVPGTYQITTNSFGAWEPQTTTVSVGAGETLDVDFQLAPRTSGTVTGTVRQSGSNRVAWFICTSLWNVGTGLQVGAETLGTGGDGMYSHVGVPAGTYTVRFRDCDTTRSPSYGTAWLGNASTMQAATTFTVGAAQDVTGKDITLVASDPVIVGVKPVITGVPQLGQALQVETGMWEPYALVNLLGQWNSNGVPIPNEDGSALVLTEDLVDTVITVTITGQASGYDSVTLTSDPTPPIASVFADVATDHFFNEQIEWMYTQAISTGYIEPSGLRTYHPLEDVSRQAMAAFLYRLSGSPSFTPPAVATFADVPVGAPFFKEIEWMKAEGITNGNVGPGDTLLYLPADSVSRQAMSAFLYRLNDSPAFVPPATPSFADVPAGSPFYKEVEWMKAVEITTGYPDGFHPVENVSRQSMAVFLYRYAHM